MALKPTLLRGDFLKSYESLPDLAQHKTSFSVMPLNATFVGGHFEGFWKFGNHFGALPLGNYYGLAKSYEKKCGV